MILVADSGSTKASWCLLKDNKEKRYFKTEGYNPYFADTNYIIKSLRENFPADIDPESITEVNYYGAGCQADKNYIVKDALDSIFPNAHSQVEVDLLAAARALLGDNPGFAAILGTGTNTCIYDGKVISQNIDSLGFILGDEGSGGALGKKLAGDYVRGYMPEVVRSKFYDLYQLTPDQIMHHIYTQPLANRFCAQFSKFIGEMLEEEYMYELVSSAFHNLFRNLVCHYKNYQNYQFNCIGSVGYNFKQILQDTAKQYNMEVGRIIPSPIEDLVEYHLKHSPQSAKNNPMF
jgi:N-acetylglucosamine kinase-like BadF-type ATPase